MTSEPQKPKPYSQPRRGSNGPSHDADGAVGNDNQGLNGSAASGMPRRPASPEPSNQQKIEPAILSKAERDELDEYFKRESERSRAPKVRVESAPYRVKIASTLDEIRRRSAFGTCDGDFASLMLSQLVNAAAEEGCGKSADRGSHQ